MFKKMKNIDLKDLDFKAAGSWPSELKYAVCAFLIFVILLLSWFLFISSKRNEYLSFAAEEVGLRQEFETKQAKASNLEPLKLQLVQMELVLQQMLRQLPSRT